MLFEQDLNNNNEDVIKQNVMDSIWKCIDGSIKPENLIELLTQEKDKYPVQYESIVADIINIIDVEIGSFPATATSATILSSNSQEPASPSSRKEKFYSIINSLRPLIGDDLLKERLEIETLESLKLIAKKEAFNQKYIKIKTRLFYKQQKFNLLREEAEGYSKLITELGQTDLNNKILENIQSLIGCFNLDPNRVLDIILESFENNPSMHVAFINLLKAYKAEDETICQIIGFKFQSLHQQEKDLLNQHQQQQQQQQSDGGGGDSSSKLDAHFYNNHIKFSTSSLYTVTSYLLQYKMIDIDLLMPHLYPSDQQIQQFYKEDFEAARQYAKKLTIVNLSASDSTSKSSNNLESKQTTNSNDQNNAAVDHQHQQQMKQQEELRSQIQTQLNRLDNQRVSLVKSLVEIGDYKTCAKLIERLPQWYLATYPDVAVEVCKSINLNVVDPMYNKCNSLSKYLKEKYSPTTTSTPSSSNNSSNGTTTSSKYLSVKLKSTSASGEESSFNDLLANFVDSVLPILSALGPGISYDTSLFTKLIRVCVEFLESKNLYNKQNDSSSLNQEFSQQQSKENSPPPTITVTSSTTNNNITDSMTTAQAIANLNQYELAFFNQIYTLLNDVLMPSLSMIVMNPCLAMELWNLLKLFPYEMRYYLFNNWRQFTYKHFPQLIRIKAECQEKIKYLLKRLTKENVKIHGRQIGKLSHNNPIIVCDYILTQIQRYDNFINPIVDSLKFLTPLSYDILSYCTIVAISDADKDKMKHDSISISSWLHSVATFCALAFKKYPIELTAIIQYVINQLKNRKSYDLLILQEIVQKMCGIEVLSEVNDLQLEAMAGGDLLRQEAGYFNPIRNIKKCANRLKEALADHGLILPLCILLSQHRDYTVFLDQVERIEQQQTNGMNQIEKRHLKLTGSLYDQCQDSLVQFSQFLSTTLTTEEYIEIFPKIDELVNEYHVSADVAFFLSRPMYAHHINSKFDELKKCDRTIKTSEKPSKTQRYLESIDVVMQPVIDLVKTLHPAKIWEDMSPLFYTTFWTLSMNDCFVPTNAYEKQRQSLKQKLNALDDNSELSKAKQRKEKEKILIMLDKLTEEENKQKDHVQHVKARFEKEKEFWFPQKSKTKNETITVFLQLCIFSRCLFTQIDAFYCAKFIQIIHSLKTPNFSTIICYDRIFSDISYSIASLTDNEARRYGRFLLGLLETVMNWHSDPVIFDIECAQFPGFLTVFRNALNTSSTPSAPSAPSSNSNQATNKQEQLDYENFRHVCHKWHYKLTKSFIVCLESEEYLQMRNSLIILTKILPHYPRLTGFCSALEKRVEKITQIEKDKKQDIHTLAVGYLGQLKLRKSQMVDEAKFHLKEQSSSSSSSTLSSSSSTNQKQSTDSTKSTSSQKNTSSSSSSDKFKQPQVPVNKSANTSGSSSSSSTNSQQNNGNSATKQISAVLQQASTSSSKNTNGQTNQVQSNITPNTVSNVSSSSSTKQTSQQANYLNGSSSKTVSSQPSSSSNASSSASNGKESSSSSSRAVVLNSSTTPTSTSNTSSTTAPNSNNNSSTTTTSQNSPPSKSRNDENNLVKTEKSSQSNGTKTSGSNSSSSSNKRTSQSSPNSASLVPAANLTPTRKINDYSPTSSVSSDELLSPKRGNSQTSNSQRHKSHSRSTSPKGNQQQHNNNGNSHYSSTKSSSSLLHDKNKRLKTDDVTNGNNNNGSSKNYGNGNTNGGSVNDYVSSSNNSSNQSTKRKSSRDRGGGGDGRGSNNTNESNNKEKKDHRKRDHSLEDGNDMQQHQKRSKSDEAKKKSSSVSSSSSTANQLMQPSQSSVSSSSGNGGGGSSSSSKRVMNYFIILDYLQQSSNKLKIKSSKKHESNKDEFQMISNNGGGGSGSHLNMNSGSSKHRSNSNIDDGPVRRSHDKMNNNLHYSKDKK